MMLILYFENPSFGIVMIWSGWVEPVGYIACGRRVELSRVTENEAVDVSAMNTSMWVPTAKKVQNGH